MRLVVLLVHLSQYLNSSRWGVTIIYWGGLGIAAATRRTGMGKALRWPFTARLRAVANTWSGKIGGAEQSLFQAESQRRRKSGRLTYSHISDSTSTIPAALGHSSMTFITS